MTRRQRARKPISASRVAATWLVGLSLAGVATVIWATPSVAAPAPPRGPASGVSVTCNRLVTKPNSSVSCTITGLLPSESASVLVAGTSTQTAAPPASGAGSSTFTVAIPAAGGSTRIVEVTAPQSHRTSSTSVTVSDQIIGGNGASAPLASGSGSGSATVSSSANRNTTIPPRALVAILIAVFGIVVLVSRKQLQRMKA